MLLHVIPWLSGWRSLAELRPPVTGDPELRKLEEQATLALELFQEQHFLGSPPIARLCQAPSERASRTKLLPPVQI